MEYSRNRALHFTRVILENWRNFGKAEVELQRRTFIVGPNASGKSNFLDVFRFLHDIVSVGRGFEQAVQSRGGVSSLRSLVARRYSDIQISVSIGEENVHAVWVYELGFNQDNLQRPIIRHERILFQGQQLFARPDEADKTDPERLTQTYLQQVNVNREFRQVAEFFSSVRYLHIVPQLVREPDRSVGRKDDPYGGDFLEQIARTPERTQSSRLNRIQDALKVAVPQLEALELRRDEVTGAPHLRGKYQH
jgi:predicted ATPase